MSYTAWIQKVKEGYIGFIEEIPGANSQGETIEEVRENLKEAVLLILEANKSFLQELIIPGENIIREQINLPS
jgi:predicted RNase H-like HicB family nuclease